MVKGRTLGNRRLPRVQRDTRISLCPVPVAPVALDLTEPHGQLIHGRLDLLEAQDVGLLPVDELLELRLARANSVDVPGCDLHPSASILFVPRLLPKDSIMHALSRRTLHVA